MVAAGVSAEAVKLRTSAVPVPEVMVLASMLAAVAFTVKAAFAVLVTVSPAPKFTVVALV